MGTNVATCRPMRSFLMICSALFTAAVLGCSGSGFEDDAGDNLDEARVPKEARAEEIVAPVTQRLHSWARLPVDARWLMRLPQSSKSQ